MINYYPTRYEALQVKTGKELPSMFLQTEIALLKCCL